MTLERLKKEMIEAKKSGNKIRGNTLVTAIAQITSAAIDAGCKNDITESFVNKELLRAQKICREMMDTCPAERVDLLDCYKEQYAIISEFAPKTITDENEIKEIINSVIKANELGLISSKTKGAFMKIAMPILKEQGVDGKIANKVITEMCNNS